MCTYTDVHIDIQTHEHKNTHTHIHMHITSLPSLLRLIKNIFLNLFSFFTHKVNIHKVKNVFILSIVSLFNAVH